MSDHSPLYLDSGAATDRRVADLLSRMTLEEKTAQLFCFVRGDAPVDEEGRFSEEKASEIFPHGIGAIGQPADLGKSPDGYTPRPAQEMAASRPCSTGPRETAEITNRIQRYFIEHTRLGIPVIFHTELLHGLAAQDGICFPQAIGLASMWDDELLEELFGAAAAEARSRGLTHALSPVVDITRDPRWGRTEETWGEDPFLASRYAAAAVRGNQGRNGRDGPLLVAATLKHFAVYGQTEGGRNTSPGNVSERVIRESFLPPFEAAVKEARAACVMPAYNEVDGIPCHAHSWLLQKVLREEWGFDGFVISDYAGIRCLCDPDEGHHIASTPEEAAALALTAGVDMEAPDAFAYSTLVDQVRSGRLSEALIDRAAGRILRIKFLLGLFENPYTDPEHAEALCCCERHVELALTSARKSMVLLKNANGTLPLKRDAVHKLAVIGPNAADCHIGGYSGWPRYAVDLLSGIRNRAGDGIEVVYAEGCRITKNRGAREWMSKVDIPDEAENRRRIEEAVETARGADAIVVAIGENEELCREGMDMDSLELVGPQNELTAALAALNKPLIAVVFNGRPLILDRVDQLAGAVIEAWYLGQETGHAVADAIFGDINPGGKLPLSFPRTTGSIPVYYNHKPSARVPYTFGENTPLYPFGFGLSYTTFRMDNLRVTPDRMAPDGTAAVSIDVTNTGDLSGDEVVQLYIRDRVSSVTRPVRELRGFKRITLEPGEKRTVTFTLGFDHLCFYNREMKRVVEPGIFDIMVGSSSADTIAVQLTVEAADGQTENVE